MTPWCWRMSTSPSPEVVIMRTHCKANRRNNQGAAIDAAITYGVHSGWPKPMSPILCDVG